MGMPGFRDVLLRIREYWDHKRDDVLQSAGQLVQAVQRVSAPEFERTALSEEMLRGAMRELLSSADRRHGGFGGAPKFPHPMDLRVLLRCWKRFGDEDALGIVRLTLDRMARGGIYDHLGSGFHRYSTDDRWLVPHFEKMLYDNALLVPTYLELWQCLQDPAAGTLDASASLSADDYQRIATEVLDYVLREMTQPEGGFYSTQDADSEGEEGRFFVWSEREIGEALGPEDARVFNYCYDVTSQGNWEGHNILNRPKTLEQAARMLKTTAAELDATLARCREKLLQVRSSRVPPGRDDKVLAGWNGMMISAMARGAQVLGEARYALAAQRAAEFILGTMRDERRRPLHSYKDGRARFDAYLDDYACLVDGLTDLYQATFEPRYLASAVELADEMRERFADRNGGGFYYTASDHQALIARSKDAQDNATPSGNGMAATALLKLGRLTGRSDLEQTGYETLETLSGLLADHPRAAGQALLALDFQLGPTKEIVLVDGADAAETQRALARLQQRFLPNMVIARRPAGIEDDRLPAVLRPTLQGRTAQGGRLTGYVCERGACGLPAVGEDAVLHACEPVASVSSRAEPLPRGARRGK
jgi:uncharacterized protein YyaL (SSP411 family)